MATTTHERGAGPAVREMPEELSPRHLGRRLLQFAVLLVVLVVAISALPGLGELRQQFANANGLLVALVAVLQLSSTFCYVIVFRGIFCPRMSWRFSYQLGMAEQATNVLLPTGGAGGLALGAWALRQGGIATEFIARRSVAMFVITSIPNFLCAAVIGTLLLARVLPGHAPVAPTAVFAFLAFAGMAFAATLPHLLGPVRPGEGGGRIRRAARAGAIALAAGVRDTGTLLRSGRPGVLGGAIGYLGFDIVALAVAFAAVGGHPAVGPLVFAYVIGQLGGLIPVPAGIGGTDGGLIGALVLYGSPLSQAAAAVLIYRVFQLAIPAVLGSVAFVQLRRSLRGAPSPAAACAPMAEPLAVLKAPA
jgi:uncharacterized membrane protein YbhN (UPF0104 family)